MGLKRFLLPDELYEVADFFKEKEYVDLDMNIVFNIHDKETLQRISDHIYFSSCDNSEDKKPPIVEGDSINVNIGNYHFIYKLVEDANYNN